MWDTATNCPDNICYTPTCTSGTCGQTVVANGITDTGCSGTIGCTGGNCSCNGQGSCTSHPTANPINPLSNYCGSSSEICISGSVRACVGNSGNAGIKTCLLNCSGWNTCVENTPQPNPSPNPQPSCTPNWECTDWSICYSTGTKIRTCSDNNNCGSQSGKPSLTMNCDYNYNASSDLQTNNNNLAGSGSNNELNGTISNASDKNKDNITATQDLTPLIILEFIFIIILIGGVVAYLFYKGVFTSKTKTTVNNQATTNQTRLSGEMSGSMSGNVNQLNNNKINNTNTINNTSTLNVTGTAPQQPPSAGQLSEYYVKYFTEQGYSPIQTRQFLTNKGLSRGPEWLAFYVKFYSDKGHPPYQVREFLMSKGFEAEKIDNELRKQGKII